MENMKIQNTININNTSEQEYKPVSREEYYKLKEEKLKKGDEALDIISGTTKIIKNNAYQFSNELKNQDVKLGVLDVEVS